MLKCGDTLEMPKRGDSTPHLWILLTDPDPATGEVVIVNVTTKRSHSDTTVILQAGDHPYIDHESTIYYADAQIRDVRLMEQAIKEANPYVKPNAACSPELLQRVKDGVHQSKFTPNKIRKLIAKPAE